MSGISESLTFFSALQQSLQDGSRLCSTRSVPPLEKMAVAVVLASVDVCANPLPVVEDIWYRLQQLRVNIQSLPAPIGAKHFVLGIENFCLYPCPGALCSQFKAVYLRFFLAAMLMCQRGFLPAAALIEMFGSCGELAIVHLQALFYEPGSFGTATAIRRSFVLLGRTLCQKIPLVDSAVPTFNTLASLPAGGRGQVALYTMLHIYLVSAHENGLRKNDSELEKIFCFSKSFYH